MPTYEIRLRRNHRGVAPISDALPFGRLWYGEPNAINNAGGYAKFRSRLHDAVIRVYDKARQRDRNARVQGRFQRAVTLIAGSGREPTGFLALNVNRTCKDLFFA